MANQQRNYAQEPVPRWNPPAYSDRIEFDAPYVGQRYLRLQARQIERTGIPAAKWEDVPHRFMMGEPQFFNPRSEDVLTQ